MDVQKRSRDNSNSKRSFILNKKAQVTVFIIIGILILFVTGMIFFLTKYTIQEQITEEGAPVIASVPTAFQPIQSFTENCLSSSAKRGLLILGEQGGHIYPDLVGVFKHNSRDSRKGESVFPLLIP